MNAVHTADYEVIVIGAGIGGIYQIKRLIDLGIRATVLEAAPDLGGTWYRNRYPGARFDSESYTYGYSFSKEVLDEWHWKERFSGQPENLRYLNFVAEKFDLRRHMQFNCRVEAAHYEAGGNLWRIRIDDGRTLTCRFLITALGILSIPTLPRLLGMDSFQGRQFHTHYWPHEPVDLAGKRVAVIGTGATGIQVISEIADKVGTLTVFQRRPNWSAPLNNSAITAEEMARIRARYDEIFARCARTPSGFEHEVHPRGFYDVSREERLALWDRLYNEPGFAIIAANYREIAVDENANAEFSEYIANRIRQRVSDQATAEKLIPRDHGFGFHRVPLETRYFEVYNRPNVRLVDLGDTPIERVTATGIRTSDADYEFDVIVYATGFDGITGAYDRIEIRGRDGLKLSDKWNDKVATYLGIHVHGFPNLLMNSGPQSVSGNYPRVIEPTVNYCTELLEYMWKHKYERVEATAEAERAWSADVEAATNVILMRKAKSWFTGYNTNVPGRSEGKYRFLVYFGGLNKYGSMLRDAEANGHSGLKMKTNTVSE